MMDVATLTTLFELGRGPLVLINHSLFTARKLRHLPGCLEYYRKYPLAGLVGFLAVNFGSSIMMSVFFRTPWSFLADDFDVPVAVLCWYLVFFSPFDVGFVVVDFMPVQFAMAAVEGVRNGAKNLDGIHYSAKAFPNSWTTAIVGGFLNACGSSFVLWMERHLRGTPALNDLNKPSGFVKLSFVVSLLAVVLLGTDSLPSLLPAVLVEYITEDVVHHLAFAVHIIFCIGAVVNKYFDPLSPLFSSLRLVFFGGISPSDDDHHHTHGRHPKPTAIDLEVKGEGPQVSRSDIAPGSATKAAASSTSSSPVRAITPPSAASLPSLSAVFASSVDSQQPRRRRGSNPGSTTTSGE